MFLIIINSQDQKKITKRQAHVILILVCLRPHTVRLLSPFTI